MRALSFSVGPRRYAVPLTTAREVIAGVEITPLPMAPTALAGLTNVRGELVPVIRTGVLLGLVHLDPERLPATEPPFAVVVDTAYGPAALLAAHMPETVDLPDGDDPDDGDDFNLVDVDEVCRPERIAATATPA
jgi:chemotaxis signal transduction protein